jgi:hypothetical protein
VAALDTASPAAFDLTGPGDGAVTNQARPGFGWTAASDTGSGLAAYQLVLDGAPFGSSYPPTATNGTPSDDLPEGTHTWTVRALDNAGNVTQASAARTIRVDRTAPRLSVAARGRRPSLARALARGVAVRLGASEAISAVVTVRVSAAAARRLRLPGRRVTIGRLAVTVKQGGTRSLRVTASVQAKRALRRARAGRYGPGARRAARRLAITLRATATDAAGNAALAASRSVRLH